MGAKLLVASIVSGLVFVVVGFAGVMLGDKFVTSYVSSATQLTPASALYPGWLQPSLPIYVKFYLFSLKNALDFEKSGAKPHFEEIGPFVYREVTIKEDIVNNQNLTISYKLRKQYFFEPGLSPYSDSMNITTLNIATITMFNTIRYRSSRLHDLVNKALELTGSTVLTKRTARELIFGYRDSFLSWLQFLDSSLVPCDQVSLYYIRNDTIVGRYTVNTGVEDFKNIGKIETFNSMPVLNYWSSDSANQINGTDGTLLPPFMDESSTPYFFSADFCRSIKATYVETIMTDYDIKLIGYALDKNTFASADTNPENAGFCTPKNNCLAAGVLNVSQCFSGKPIILSNPHFLNADKKFLDDVNGLHMTPEEAEYNSMIYVEPLTGIPMKSNKRVQVNIQLFRDSRIRVTQRMPEILYPLFWLDQSFVADKEATYKFYKKVQLPINILYYSKYTLLGLGTLMLTLSAIYIGLLVIKHRRLHQQMNNLSINTPQTERSPLLAASQN